MKHLFILCLFTFAYMTAQSQSVDLDEIWDTYDSLESEDKHKDAIVLLENNLKYFDKDAKLLGYACVLFYLGNLYSKIEDYSNAEKYYLRTKKFCEKNGQIIIRVFIRLPFIILPQFIH